MPLDNVLPNVSPLKMINITPGIMNGLIIAIMLGVVVAFVIRMARHRVLVEIYEYVNGGYAMTTGRYANIFDKKTNMHVLVSMFGSKRLPAYSSQAYQKTMSAPLIGTTRKLRLVKQNKHTYHVIVPQYDFSTEGHVMDYNTRTWIYREMTRQFDKIVRRVDLQFALSYLAPVIVIVVCIFIFVMAIYTDQILLQRISASIMDISQALVAVISK